MLVRNVIRVFICTTKRKVTGMFLWDREKMCFLVCTKQKQIHATWASTIRSVSALATPLHLLLACFSCLVCFLWFVPYLFISHSSCLIQRLALPRVVWHPFFSTPSSLWKTLCPPVLKFRSEGEMSWQHFLGLLPLHLDVSKTSPSGRSSPELKLPFVYSVPNNRWVVRMTVFHIIFDKILWKWYKYNLFLMWNCGNTLV